MSYKQKYKKSSFPFKSDKKRVLKESKPVYGGLLPEVEVSALTDESYSKLNKPQKQVYDSFKLRDGAIAQTVQVGKKYNKDRKANTRDMHYSDALDMVKNEGIKSIKNKPSMIMNFSGKSDNFNRDGTKKERFRPHINPFTGVMRVSKFNRKDTKRPYSNKVIERKGNDKARFAFMKDVIAETAHMPEFWRKETLTKERLGNVFSDIKGEFFSKNSKAADTKRYKTKGHYEYKTHTGPNSFEEKLRKKYAR